MDTTGVNTFVELIGDDTEVSVLHDDIAWDGVQDLLAIFIPAGEETPPSSSCGDMSTWIHFVLPEQNKFLTAYLYNEECTC